ncbi:hypothetical protein FB446DRAFT_709788 [Lentinula raphanica]|nr:hypothetical protein FB446DRAFT_709788 [Lentinula raphanica]
MELIDCINKDIRLVQDSWDAEVEQRSRLMSVACVSMEEDRNSFSHLASETRKLLAHVVTFTKSSEHTLTKLDTAYDVPFAKWIPRNAELLHRIILQLPRMGERMSADPSLRLSSVSQVEEAYSEGASRPRANLLKDDLSLLLLPKRPEMRRVLTAASELDSFLQHLPIARAQHSSIPTHDALTLTQTVSAYAFDSSPSTDLQCDKKSIDSIDYKEVDPNLFFCASLEDLKSKFFSAKERKLRLVLQTVQQFRADGKMIALELAQAHENLRARLQRHQNLLDSLNKSVENIIMQVDLNLNILHEKPSGEADRLDPLEFGQPYTTGYIEELWLIALRLLPLKGERSTGYIKNQVLDELHRFDGIKLGDNPIHSSFMINLDVERSEIQTKQCYDRQVMQPVLEFETLSEAEEIASAHPLSYDADYTTTSMQAEPTAEEMTVNPLSPLRESNIFAASKSALRQVLPGGVSLFCWQYTIWLCEIISSWIASFAYQSHTLSASILVESGPLFVRTRNYVVDACLSFEYLNISRMAPFVCSVGAQITSIARLLKYSTTIVFVRQWHFRKDTRSHLPDVLVFLLKYSTTIKILLVLFAGFLFALKLKLVVDRLIVEVSHHYLAAEFREMLRHDAESVWGSKPIILKRGGIGNDTSKTLPTEVPQMRVRMMSEAGLSTSISNLASGSDLSVHKPRFPLGRQLSG